MPFKNMKKTRVMTVSCFFNTEYFPLFSGRTLVRPSIHPSLEELFIPQRAWGERGRGERGRVEKRRGGRRARSVGMDVKGEVISALHLARQFVSVF